MNVPAPESAPRRRGRFGDFDAFDSGGRVSFRPESLWRNAVVVNTTPTRFGDYPDGGKGNRGITIRLPERDRLDIGGGAGDH
ncbi:hypothetical protein [Amycolatopsis kentuckyensis]|uniref:hypothetical protein n=1 Tax=Amycolatopsis kentuckyensis TaxID=218823 RepID=UPI00117749FB|nr:hypothetical protein [Amycolatopsis kentuckyensis]